MADSFFGFDTSVSNFNDDEGGGEPSEDEYDALNDETFGQDSDDFDWEVEHEQLAEKLESSRRVTCGIDDEANSKLEASLSQLILDDTDLPQHRGTLGSSVWRHDPPVPSAQTPVSHLKNVCTVEELERQLRQNQMPPQSFSTQNYFQPRFPLILQRPPGLSGQVPMFNPQQGHGIVQMSQPLNKVIGQNTQINQMVNTNQLLQNQLNQNANQFVQSTNQLSNPFQSHQIGQNLSNHIPQKMQNLHQMGQSNLLLQNQMGQGFNPIGPNINQIGQNFNQVGQNVNQLSQNTNQLGPNMNKLSHNMNQLNQNVNQINQNMNQLGQNMNQIIPNPNNNLFTNMNQFTHMMGQSRMMPPPGLQIQRPNFTPSTIGPFNPTVQPQSFRPPSIAAKQSIDQQTVNQQQNILINQQLLQPPQQQQQQQQQKHPQQQLQQQQQQLQQQQQQQHQQQQQQQQQLQQQQQQQQHQQPQMKNQTQSVTSNVMKPVVHQMNQQQNNLQIQKGSLQNQRMDLKLSKTRSYTNSSQKNIMSQNLTSQNLVQLIQNTHPMLQFNSSFHNASHHPMLNNRNNMFNNNQFMNNHPMYSNQGQNGLLFNNNNRNQANGDDSSVNSDGDEYAGLMTSREKQWLINIQILQLNTGTPYIHDFYYTVFLERQSKKEKEGIKEAHKANQQNHPFYSGGVTQENHHGRERHNSVRHNSTSEDPTPRTYVPTQFENSLGKLQCGSVTAPRKIIDLEVVATEPPSARASRAPSVASTTNPAEVPRELKRTKQLLLDIESLYLILLRIEELNDPLAISNALILKEREEKQKLLEAAQKELENEQEEDTNLFLRNIESVQRRPKQDSPKSENIDKRQVVNLAISQKPAPVKNLLDEDKDELVIKMFAGLLHSDRLGQILTVRKGRSLVCRFVSRVAPTHALLRTLWSRVLRAVPTVARRDDGSLAPLAIHYRKYIQNSNGWLAVLESCGLLSETFDPARTPYSLTTPFTLSCVCALIEKASVLSNTPEATSNERQWYKFLKTLARALKNTTLKVAKPLHPLPEVKLLSHTKQLESRSTVEILQRGRTTTEFADLTKTDITEQLVKHLC